MTFQRAEKIGCDWEYKDATLEHWRLKKDGQNWRGRKRREDDDTLKESSSILQYY